MTGLILSLRDAEEFSKTNRDYCYLIILNPMDVDPRLGCQLTLQFDDIDHTNIERDKYGLPSLVPPVRSHIEVALAFLQAPKWCIVSYTAEDPRAVAFGKLMGLPVDGTPNQLIMTLGESLCRGGSI